LRLDAFLGLTSNFYVVQNLILYRYQSLLEDQVFLDIFGVSDARVFYYPARTQISSAIALAWASKLHDGLSAIVINSDTA
jgi:hypothetical protein